MLHDVANRATIKVRKITIIGRDVRPEQTDPLFGGFFYGVGVVRCAQVKGNVAVLAHCLYRKYLNPRIGRCNNESLINLYNDCFSYTRWWL